MLARLMAYLRGIARRRAIDVEIEDELRFHLEKEIEAHMARGTSAAESRRMALRDLGGLAQTREAVREVRTIWGTGSLQDYKLGVRMLVKYPGLTIAGGLALAIAIGLGAGWYDVTQQMFRPTLPLPEGDRLVEIELRNSLSNRGEWRVLHDFLTWRRDLRSIEDLGVYQDFDRNLVVDGARAGTVRVAATTASAFGLARVAPLVGRPLVDADARPGAPAVVVIGHDVWQRWFGGRADAIGQDVKLGRATATVVGVMPERFTFPINHQAWVPLQLRASGYAPLEGPGVRMFGRLAPGVTDRQAFAELTALTKRAAAASPRTHEHLRPELRPYGGESDAGFVIDFAATHVPALLVLIVACTTVGTLVYARTATRSAEIAMRSALGATRGRIVGQLFVEALVLASVAALVGLAAAHWILQWGTAIAYSAGLPFWVHSGLTLTTVVYAAGLTVVAAAMLGVFPALKATGSHVQSHLRNMGAGGSTLGFGRVWTAAMIFQVTLTVICLPPAMGISEEAVRDRIIRSRFPADEYLAARVELDRDAGPIEEAPPAFQERMTRIYEELERRVAQEPGVAAVTFADNLPGMNVTVRRAEVEALPGAAVRSVRNLWTSTVGPGFFEAFDKPIVAGRGFHDGDHAAGARTVIVNEAFARRFTRNATPVGMRVRYAAADSSSPEPWLEIVGVVRDIGMTPTDFGEAPYLFRAGSAGAVYPPVMGVRASGDPAVLGPRLQAMAADLDPALRLAGVRRLDAAAWEEDIPAMVIGGALVGTVGLGMFLSAAGIFSLISVSVARRTREIGVRIALGASPGRVLASILLRAGVLVGSGVAVGNLVLLLLVALDDETGLGFLTDALVKTSVLMMIVALLACVGPARRALRINPTEALKEA